MVGHNEEIVRQGLNTPYRSIYDVVGNDERLFWELVEEFRGLQVNFPVRIYNAEKVESLIVNEYDSTNATELAKRYGFSKRWVDGVLKRNWQDIANTDDRKQIK
ncbi:hypothetical protein EQG49_05715 [Periweissella cryptocerci]|uniref:Mor transcription activator domain-containing protein n=2 Tax=Periweissella cryptocerci TaxID=2506420 RepID=A0A4V1AJ19_9LACO|nr:hypothetical protein EQG49_05715 [Periweissella cryptocerci]